MALVVAGMGRTMSSAQAPMSGMSLIQTRRVANMIKKIFPRAMKVVQALVEILEILVMAQVDGMVTLVVVQALVEILEILVVVQAEITIWPY